MPIPDYISGTQLSITFASAIVLAYLRLHKMPEEYPAIEGGGSLILAWQIRNKRVLVVGGGEVCSFAHTLPMPAVATDCRLHR